MSHYNTDSKKRTGMSTISSVSCTSVTSHLDSPRHQVQMTEQPGQHLGQGPRKAGHLHPRDSSYPGQMVTIWPQLHVQLIPSIKMKSMPIMTMVFVTTVTPLVEEVSSFELCPRDWSNLLPRVRNDSFLHFLWYWIRYCGFYETFDWRV